MCTIRIWHGIGDARYQHGGWRSVGISPTCHAISPIPHVFCTSSFPNYVVVGMHYCASIFSLYVFVRIDCCAQAWRDKSDKRVSSDEIIPATPANSRYAAML